MENTIFDDYIKNSDYKGLLEYTNEILEQDKNNQKALETKSKALIALRDYEKAYEILNMTSTGLNMNSLKKLTYSLINFNDKYKKNSEEIKSIPEEWYKEGILREIENFQKVFIQNNKEFLTQPCKFTSSTTLLKLHEYALGEKAPTYILGPDKVVNTFKNFDIGILYELISNLTFPYVQGDFEGWLFTRDQNYFLPYGKCRNWRQMYIDDGPTCIAPFPVTLWHIDNDKYIQPDKNCDAFYSNELVDDVTHKMIVNTLDILAKNTKDYFVPMYQNIIDPNLTAVKQGDNYQWTATEFVIEERSISKREMISSLQLCMYKKDKRLGKYIIEKINNCLRKKVIPKAHIASPISNIPIDNIELYVSVEEVLNAALPLLSRITKPALLFPGKLQAVVKAQRIYLKSGEEYDGVWHRDGKYENIIAVVIYYYRVSKQLIGGDLEIMDKRPIEDVVWVGGEYPEDFSTKQAQEKVNSIPQCRIPIKNGSLVVFSNYQNIHRVLKMTCSDYDDKSPDGCASRDFLLLFIVDQTKPLMSTNSDLSIQEDRYEVREDMFSEQLEPTGVFTSHVNYVYSTGNGRVGQIGWLNDFKNYVTDEDFNSEGNRPGCKNIEKMNEYPPLGRGKSWAFDDV
jgi:hypothetical protein